MSRHTPGPWVAKGEHERGDIAWVDAGLLCIAECPTGEDGQKMLANARLIAAAPELLAALEDMLNGWRYIRSTHGDLYGVGWDRAQEKAEAAIAKADGQA